MDFTRSSGEISEISDRKLDTEPNFSSESLAKYESLFDEEDWDEEQEPEMPDIAAEMKEETLSGIQDFKEDPEAKYESLFDEETDNSAETKELTEEEKQQKIQEFLDGKAEFDEVKEIFAGYYADAVNSNRPWSWDENVPGSENLTGAQRKAVTEYARETEMVPTVSTREVDGKRYADFSPFTVFECILDREDWNKTDSEQFRSCNEMLKNAIKENPALAEKFTDEQLEQIERGETPTGYTWHHSEIDGTMQLVLYGIHHTTNHHGGRSEGGWANSPRY